MPIRFKFETNAPEVVSRLRAKSERVHDAMVVAAEQAADDIQAEGRVDIAQAGAFGARWIFGFHAEATRTEQGADVNVWDDVPYFRIGEYGGVIKGKPLLWIPIDSTDPTTFGISARDYAGGLFRVDRAGASGAGFKGQKRNMKTGRFTGGFLAPLLLDYKTHEVKYFGKPFVTWPQKFHIREISRAVARKVPGYFKEAWKSTAMG